ncbi:unnamed protein product [Didymodactylos carnosus]|uniref:DZIP3-like HEPN domain-containing protein n=1 Tax=Didymodactylos carnosus TaxID=1234261 RepID=A0A814SYS0_9BILA|nr:unnamed protein product [Didymodactylos carnosus]CAF3917795.1 unnamed protein product [Didymodactylos carnosus]
MWDRYEKYTKATLGIRDYKRKRAENRQKLRNPHRFKLELLVVRSNTILRRLFKNCYHQFFGQSWDNSTTCDTNSSKTSVRSGNSNDWDHTTLTTLLLNTSRLKTLNQIEEQQLDSEDKLLVQVREISGQLAHHPTRNVSGDEFNQLWQQLRSILVHFGEADSELDKLKDNIEVKSSIETTIDSGNVKEALPEHDRAIFY